MKRARKAWNGGSIVTAMAAAHQRTEAAIASGCPRCSACNGDGGLEADQVCPRCGGAGFLVPWGGMPMPPKEGVSMTIVVYRDGILAADTGVWSDSNVIAYHLLKVHRLSNGALVGGGGGPGFCQWFLRWCERGCPALEQAFPDPGEASFAGLHISRCGDVTHYGANMLPVSVDAPYHVIGAPSAIQFALGALAAGACAVQAVALAIQNTDGAAGSVNSVSLSADQATD